MRCAISLVLIEIAFVSKGDDQGQIKRRRKVSEAQLESKVVELKNASEQQMCKIPGTGSDVVTV